MYQTPIKMEQYFAPGFKTKPAVHIGSQTMRFFHGIAKEQAYEAWHLAGASVNDVVVTRNLDPLYIQYWQSLVDNPTVINYRDDEPGIFLTESILKNPDVIAQIKKNMHASSRLMVFLPTELEQKMADTLGIPLHGSVRISNIYGTKSGIRQLAAEAKIPMAPGFICRSYKELKKAIEILREHFTKIIIKHDLSLSGLYSKKLICKKVGNLRKHLDEVSGGRFVEGKDLVVVEGWIKSNASLCAHIEIAEGKDPVVCAGWQQIIDSDGITYIGAGPLRLSKKALNSFLSQTHKLAWALKKNGAVGSYGPDFLVTAAEETSLEPDTCILVELNARAPYTAFPLETVKHLRGKIGEGFCSLHITLPKAVSFWEIKRILSENRLLINGKNDSVRGVVPFNIGLLPWKLFDVVAMAETWEETKHIVQKVKKLFRNNT